MFTAKELFEQLLKAEKQGLLEVNLSYPVFKKKGLTSIALHIDIDDSSYVGKVIEEDKERVLLKHRLEQEQDELKNNQPNTFKNQADRYTYLMIDNRNKLYKIGKSNKPGFREKTLQSEVPEVRLLAYCEEKIISEKILHQLFEDKRVRGEWFKLEDNDVNRIVNLMLKYDDCDRFNSNKEKDKEAIREFIINSIPHIFNRNEYIIQQNLILELIKLTNCCDKTLRVRLQEIVDSKVLFNDYNGKNCTLSYVQQIKGKPTIYKLQSLN